MTRDTTTELLIRLIQRVPVHVVNTKAAEARGDVPALAYHRAITVWLREATEAVAEIRQGITPPEGRHGAPDPFSRAAAASAMMHTDLEPAAP